MHGPRLSPLLISVMIAALLYLAFGTANYELVLNPGFEENGDSLHLINSGIVVPPHWDTIGSMLLHQNDATYSCYSGMYCEQFCWYQNCSDNHNCAKWAVRQALPTSATKNYTVSFWYTRFGGDTSIPTNLYVYWDATLLWNRDFPSGSQAWTQFTTTVTADTTNSILEFDFASSDSCVSIDEVSVVGEYGNHDPPTTSTVSFSTMENTPTIVQLNGTDASGHELTAQIVETPTNDLDGYFFQYNDTCWASALAVGSSTNGTLASCVPIISGSNVTFSATQMSFQVGGRASTSSQVIYVPYTYANTDGIPSVYKISPNITYMVTQVANQRDIDKGSPLMSSFSAANVLWNVSHVNQAPTVAFPSTPYYLSFPSTAPTLDPALCGALVGGSTSCNFSQNLGAPFLSPLTPAALYFQGSDVDSTVLHVVIQSMACSDPLMNFYSAAGNYSSIVLPWDLGSFPADSFATLLAFTPSQDIAAAPYCTIQYNMFDGELYSADMGQIVINITSSPQPPRISPLSFLAPSIAPHSFTASAKSVNNLDKGIITLNNITSLTVKCTVGDFNSILLIDGILVNCSLPKTVIPVQNVGLGDYTYQFGQLHMFNVTWTPTIASANSAGFRVSVYANDTQGLSSISAPVDFLFKYIIVNQAPALLYVASGRSPSDYASYRTFSTDSIWLPNAENASIASIGYYAYDPDAPASAILNATISLSAASNDTFLTFPRDTEGLVSSLSLGVYYLQANISEISSILQSMNLEYVANDTSFTISISIHDQGYSGNCSLINLYQCDKQGNAVLTVTVSANPPPAPVAPPPIPVAPSPVSCSGSPPGPSFVCLGSVWVYNGTISQSDGQYTTITIPGPTLVLGNISVPEIVFQGLENSYLNVSGCASTSNLTLNVNLTETDVISLQNSGGAIHVLLSQNESCVNDLSTLPLSISQPIDCRVVKDRYQSSNQAQLTVYFFVDDSSCGTSGSRWWIILVSVIGGVVVLAAVFAILVFKVPRLRSIFRPHSKKRQAVAVEASLGNR